MPGFEIIFWFFVCSTAYAYLVYPVLMFLLSCFSKPENNSEYHEIFPDVTLFVTAYNEQDSVDEKVQNSLELDYPEDKLKLVWVTDGSNDQTNHKLSKYPMVSVYFEPERHGKIHAMNRGIQFINSEVVIFSDANTLLSPSTIKEMVKRLGDKSVGCVAGEKRIVSSEKEDAASAGEGIYWRYESWLKKLDSTVGSTIGAAGELFAIRRELFQPVEEDTLLDDFVISLRLAMQGYKIAYASGAVASEKASASVAEEMKRKVRIAAGSFQSLVRLKGLMNPFKYGFLSFQYISHKVFRWVIIPFGLLIIFPVNGLLAFVLPLNHTGFYELLWWLQVCFYLAVGFGYLVKNRKVRIPVLFVPYYFFMANLAMWLGFFRYITGKQSVRWERAKRAS